MVFLRHSQPSLRLPLQPLEKADGRRLRRGDVLHHRPLLAQFETSLATGISCTGVRPDMARVAATPAAWPRIMYCGSMRAEE